MRCIPQHWDIKPVIRFLFLIMFVTHGKCLSKMFLFSHIFHTPSNLFVSLPTEVTKIRQLMKKIVFTFLLLAFSFRLAAQIDYLEPVRPFSTYKGELGEYYRSVFPLLNTGF